MEHTAGDALRQGGGDSKEAFGEIVSELYNATKSVLHRIPIFKQQVRQDSQAFAPRLVSTAAASDEENRGP